MVKSEIQNIKLRFGIIGNAEGLNRAIDIAIQVAPTDLSVLVTGESGVGKESFPQIIHQFSRRNTVPISQSTVAQYLKELLIQSFSGMRKGLLPELSVIVTDILLKPMGERFFWMRWANYHYPHKRVCCVSLSLANILR